MGGFCLVGGDGLLPKSLQSLVFLLIKRPLGITEIMDYNSLKPAQSVFNYSTLGNDKSQQFVNQDCDIGTKSF